MSALGILGITVIVWGLWDLLAAGASFLRAFWILLTEVIPNLVLWLLRR